MLTICQARADTVTLRFYDRNGTLLTAAQARALIRNGTAGWDNDALIDPATLQNLSEQPLSNITNGLTFNTLAQPVALALNWPTVRGYSLLIADNGGAGFSSAATVNFTFQAAKDARRQLDMAVAARPDYQRSAAFQAAYDDASSHLDAGVATSSESERGRQGQLALDDLAVAMDLMLYEYGIAYRNAHPDAPTWIGFTMDTVAGYKNLLDLAKSIGGNRTWVRIVVDEGQAPSAYTAAVAYADSVGVKVMMEVVDSYYVKNYARATYLERIKLFVDAIPNVDAWEVGNEVNGNWLGAGAGEKIADAAAYVRAKRPGTPVVVNLYWQMGTDAPVWSMFNWARANLPAAVRSNVDVFLFSAYIEDAPAGFAFDRIMTELQEEFPGKKIGIGEMDYWLADTSKAWWYIDPTDPTGKARRGLARQYYGASLGYSASVGGVFWWEFAEEMPVDPALVQAVKSVVDAIQPVADTTPPTVPTELTASAFSDTQVNLFWTASTDDAGVKGYTVRRNGAIVHFTAANSFSDIGLAPGTVYTYDVQAMDTSNNVSAFSGVALTVTADNPPGVFSDDFSAYAKGSCLADGARFGLWTSVYNGFGCNKIETDGTQSFLYESPLASAASSETHASLVVGPSYARSVAVRADMRTVQQLRTGSPANAWEVAWIFWNYIDNTHFYYFIPKTNGWELGKGDPAYPGAQRFLAMGSAPSFPLGSWHKVDVVQSGNRMSIYVDGALVIAFVDQERPYTSGRIGFYNEDATVHFTRVKASNDPMVDVPGPPAPPRQLRKR